MYDPEKFTYGIELEYADVYRFNYLPEGTTWNSKDYTLVNSDGTANDPLGELNVNGGEINTKPTTTIKEQLEVIKEIKKHLRPKPVINYRCALHVHIGVPGLKDDLENCKKFFRYSQENLKRATEITNEIPEYPKREDSESEEIYNAKLRRYRQKKNVWFYKLPEKRFDKILEAKTTKEFYEEHAPVGKTNNRLWHISPRPAINMRQLFEETHTIEFRHFNGTLKLKEIENCLTWSREFVNAGLNTGKLPDDILKENSKMRFPNTKKFDYELEKTYNLTRLDKNTREKVREILEKLGKPAPNPPDKSKKYIKFFGTFGSGKTAMIRKLSKYLTGKPCDDWIKSSEIHPLPHFTCKCGKYTALGNWKKENKCCGTDAITGAKKYGLVERFKRNYNSIKGKVIFEDGIMTASSNIQNQLNEITEMYPVLLDYDVEECAYRIGVLRGGKVNKPNIEEKIKTFTSVYGNLKAEKKMRLSGTLDENVKKIIEECGLEPCNCMKEETNPWNLI